MDINNNCKYSIIVPIYNRENTLKRCVDSILNQTISDFELILINDGSKDNSRKICDEYKKKDSRVVVIHQENGGVSRARNAGLEIAKGKYIVFVDSDDYVDDTYLEQLDAGDADFVSVGYTRVSCKKKFKREHNNKYYSLKDKGIIFNLLNEEKLTYICGKKFKTEIIKNNNIKLIEGLNLGEDTCFVCEYLFYCNDLQYLNGSGYIYVCDNETSLCRNRGFDEKFIEIVELFYYKLQEIFYRNYGEKEKIDRMIDEKKSGFYLYFLFELLKSDEKYSSIKRFYKKDGMIYLLNNVDTALRNEGKLLRKILKTRSPLLLWLYIKVRRLKR